MLDEKFDPNLRFVTDSWQRRMVEWDHPGIKVKGIMIRRFIIGGRIRLKGYDYSQPGAYFVTICLQDKDSRLFGEIVDGEIRLSCYGEIVWKCWKSLPRHYSNVKLDEFVVMPNHVHGVIWLMDVNVGVGAGDNGIGVGAGLQNSYAEDVKPARTIYDRHDEPGDARTIRVDSMPKGEGIKYPLSEIIRGFKTFSARRINELRGNKGIPVWQRNYYEHIIRDDGELQRIRVYIVNNPVNWGKDKLK